MHRIYFQRDYERGATATYSRFLEEVEELGEALEKRNEEAMKEEFADVFAWLLSLANIFSVDLEMATLKKYTNKCPKCKQKPCECPYW